MFSGSYDPEDAVFLLKPVALEPTPVAEKEWLIQSGQRHYSEMISREERPSAAYLRLFHESFGRVRERFARDLFVLAEQVSRSRRGDIALVSLARAGTPIGAILNRLLRRQLGRESRHYSISIIRDRGIDEVALGFILEHHDPSSLVFVDGWTGKGVIARELHKSVAAFNEKNRMDIDPRLFVVADLCGMAGMAATSEDYLIPSSVLGCTISGLVSRSILNREVVGPGEFHACLYYEEYADADLSRWFVDSLSAVPFNRQDGGVNATDAHGAWNPRELRNRSESFLQEVMKRFNIRDLNHVKPGIGEATRVLMRRVPDCLVVRDDHSLDVSHLLMLARAKGVPIVVEPSLSLHALALIRELEV